MTDTTYPPDAFIEAQVMFGNHQLSQDLPATDQQESINSCQKDKPYMNIQTVMPQANQSCFISARIKQHQEQLKSQMRWGYWQKVQRIVKSHIALKPNRKGALEIDLEKLTKSQSHQEKSQRMHALRKSLQQS